MNQLEEFRKDLETLTEEEWQIRNEYLKNMLEGKICGPMTGFASIDKPWLKYFDDESFKGKYESKTLYEYLLFKNANNLSKIALNYFGTKITFEKMFKKINEVSEKLIAMGLKSGDVVSLCIISQPEVVYLIYALNKLGITVNMIDPRTSKDGIIHKMHEANSRTLFMHDRAQELVSDFVENNIADNVVLLSPFDSLPFPIKTIKKINDVKINKPHYYTFEDFMKFQNNKRFEYRPNNIAMICYTGGTTGEPKGVKLTNDNFNYMSFQYERHDLGTKAGQKFLAIITPTFAFGACNSLHLPLTLGMETILVPKFEPTNFQSLLHKYHPNHTNAVPSYYQTLLDDKRIVSSDVRNFYGAGCGGSDMLEKEEQNIIDRFKELRSPAMPIKGYGMTELASAVIICTNKCNKIGSVGIPLVRSNIKIIDPETKEELNYNETGEILLKSPTMMDGYLNHPEETSELIKSYVDGTWVHTGDLGYVDNDGCLFIKGRIKRLIIKRGMKVFPIELENLIANANIEGIENCCVFGVPDETYREVPVVQVQIKDDYLQYEDEILEKIKAVCIKSLPEYAVPSDYFAEDIPQTAMGKNDFVRARRLYDVKKQRR